MKLKNILSIALICAFALTNAHAQNFSSDELNRRTLQRRAVEVAIWGMPSMAMDAMRQAFFRVGATYGDVAFMSQVSDWKFLVPTPNNSTRYVYINYNTAEGPVVLDLPPATDRVELFGTAIDAWSTPLADIGRQGLDQGKGGKYLLLPPGFKGEVPTGYIPVRSETYNGYLIPRAITKTASEADAASAIAMIKQIKLYPLSKASNPPATRYVDITGKVFDGVMKFDESYYASLAKLVNEEPVQPRDKEMMSMLRSIGIEKGKEFKPDAATQAVLKEAIKETHAWVMDRLVTFGDIYWPDAQWGNILPPIFPQTEGKLETANYIDVDTRAILYFSLCAPVVKLGAATYYLSTFKDAGGARLSGENTYRLHVPPNVPAKQFWAMTVYSLEEATFIRESTRQSIDSYDQKVKKNADGSVDLYFAPKPPAGQEANWISTVAGKAWYPIFRFYGPDKALFDKTWKLPDIEKVK